MVLFVYSNLNGQEDVNLLLHSLYYNNLCSLDVVRFAAIHKMYEFPGWCLTNKNIGRKTASNNDGFQILDDNRSNTDVATTNSSTQTDTASTDTN